MTTLPRSRRRPLRFSRSLAAFLAAGVLGLAGGWGPAEAETGSELRVGSPVERAIASGETHEYSLPLAARTYMVLELKPAGGAVEGRLLSRNGGPVAEAGGRDEPGRTRLLALITDRADDYRFVVTSRSQPTFRYRLSVLDQRPAKAGDADRVKARRLLIEGRRLRSRGSEVALRGALQPLRQALVLAKARADGRAKVEILSEIGGIQGSLGQVEEAFLSHSKALEASRASGYREGEAWALGNMAYYRLQAGRMDEALRLYESAVQEWRTLDDPGELSATLQGLAKVYIQRGDYDRAMGCYEEALKLARETSNLFEESNALGGIGLINFDKANYNEAEKLLKQSLGLSRAVGDKDAENIYENNLGSVYYNNMQLQKAIDIFSRLAREGPDKGLVFANLGALYLDLGDLERALDSYRNAVSAYKRFGNVDGEMEARATLGWTLQRMGNPQEALEECRKAAKVSKREKWSVLQYGGLALLELHRPEEAERSIQRALKVAREKKDSVREAHSLLALGSVDRALGKLDLAAQQYELAIELGRSIGLRNIEAPGLLRRAMLHRNRNQMREALADIEAALAIIESTRNNIAGQQIRTAFLASRQSYYEFYVDLLMELDGLHPGEGRRTTALEISERGRSRGLLDLIAEGRIDVRQGLPLDLKEREDRLADELSRIQRELREGTAAPERVKALNARLAELDHLREQLDWDIRDRDQRYAQVRYPTPLKLDQIQVRLDGATAFLEYSLGTERSWLFVVTREGLTSYQLPPAKQIAEQVLDLRTSLERESPLTRGRYLELAQRLYREIVAPAEAALAGKPNLIIAPDRDLYYVPFEALLTGPDEGRPFQDLPYFVRQHTISYIPSASVLAELEKARLPERRRSLVAFAPFADAAAPVREVDGKARTRAAEDWSFAPLPKSRQEVSEIAALYSGTATQFLGAEASEETFKNNPAVASAERLHFATHAQVRERDPENSALVLAKPAGGREDGLLQVHEIFNLKLSADLAVLSACQTGLGKQMTGEGLVGLTRAFFYAGVPSLVVSLWNVIDGSTADLMLGFYKQLDQDGDKAAALRSAKLSMIRDGRYSHPSYWAPFILIGQPR